MTGAAVVIRRDQRAAAEYCAWSVNIFADTPLVDLAATGADGRYDAERSGRELRPLISVLHGRPDDQALHRCTCLRPQIGIDDGRLQSDGAERPFNVAPSVTVAAV